MDPEGIRIVREGNARTHGHHIGIDRDREHDGREDGEHLHGEIELVREEGIIRRLQGLDGLLVALENVPDADIRANEILEIDLQFIRDEWVVVCDERFENGSLRFQSPAKIEDVPFGDGDLIHHFFFLFGEDLTLDEIELLGDVIQSGEAGIEEYFQDGVEEVGGRFFEVIAALALALPEGIEESFQLIDGLFVSGDEVILREDDVEFPGIGRPVFHVEEGCVDGEEETVFILDHLRLIGGRHEFFHGQGVDIEIFLQIEDILLLRIFEIDPRDGSVLDHFHRWASIGRSACGRCGRWLFLFLYL